MAPMPSETAHPGPAPDRPGAPHRAVRAAGRAAGGAVYLGQGAEGWAWAGPERSTLVLGPSRAGKTSSIVVPNVLAAPGAVVSTSTKPDVLAATAGFRSRCGDTFLYDPSGTVEPPDGVVAVGWSPVNASSTWDGALLTADAMVRSARGGAGPAGGDDHWSERAAALLAPLLHAAATSDTPMASVLAWVDGHDGAPALGTLADRCGEGHPATMLLTGILTTDSRERSGIWSTASGVLAAYRSTAALASTEPPYLDPSSFCAGANTLYVCAAGRRQRLLAPLVVGFLDEIRDAAYERSRTGPGPPVLLALDELANVAPLPDLPALVTEGPGQGLLTLACLQDLSQARARWGREGDALVSLFGATVVLPGIADVPTLEALSAIGGDVEVPLRSVGQAQGSDGRLQHSATTTVVFRRRLPVEVLARGRPGSALALDAANRAGWLRLTPAHATWPWRELVGRGREHSARDLAPGLGPEPPARGRG